MRKVLLAAAVVALVAIGCGGGDDGPSGSAGASTSSSASPGTGGGTTTPAARPGQLAGPVNDHGTKEISAAEPELEMEADDFYFAPTFVTAAAGQKVTVKVNNEGDATHTFTIDDLGVDQELKPGESADVDITLPADGTVTYYCRFHQGQGMQGAFTLGAAG